MAPNKSLSLLDHLKTRTFITPYDVTFFSMANFGRAPLCSLSLSLPIWFSPSLRLSLSLALLRLCIRLYDNDS